MKDKKSPKARSARETNPNVLRVALVNKHRRKIEAKGQFEFPCAPSMVDVYVKVLTDLFASLARVFNEAEARELTRKLKKHADEAFAASQYARLVVEYQTELPPHPGIAYTIKTKPVTMGDEYATWVDLRLGELVLQCALAGHPKPGGAEVFPG